MACLSEKFQSCDNLSETTLPESLQPGSWRWAGLPVTSTASLHSCLLGTVWLLHPELTAAWVACTRAMQDQISCIWAWGAVSQLLSLTEELRRAGGFQGRKSQFSWRVRAQVTWPWSKMVLHHEHMSITKKGHELWGRRKGDWSGRT